jgi:SAM-dependent methyltransferase
MEVLEVDCPVCGSDKSRHLFSVRDYVFRVSQQEFGVRRCRHCGAGFLSPRPRPGDIGQFYPKEFYWIYEGADEGGVKAEELLERRSAQIANKLQLMSHLTPGRLLDIGAMKGEFVHSAAMRGWRGEGVEFGCDVPNPLGVPMHYGEFLDITFPRKTFDCVTMWAVLEHVYQPREYVHKVSRLLSKGGTFMGVVTNFNSIHARLMRADDYPRHLTMFTKRSLASLMAEAGLKPVRMWTDQKLFGGQLRGALRLVTKRMLGYSMDEALYEMRDRHDLLAFGGKFRGRRSQAVRWLSRIDKASLWLPEKGLDFCGLGFNLGFEARKQ